MTESNPPPINAVQVSEQPESLTPGVTCEWLDDRQIVVYTIATVARTAIDVLLERMKAVLRDWPTDRPYLALYTLGTSSPSQPGGPTPYIRERFREVPQMRPEIEAHIAIISTRSFQGQLVRLYTQARGNAARIFFSREEGLAWLREFLDTSPDRGNEQT